jgi:hypothetical protein
MWWQSAHHRHFSFCPFQVIQNACATQALISILLNCPGVELGPTLTDFREFAMAMDPAMKGLALSNSERIRQVHNSFSRYTRIIAIIFTCHVIRVAVRVGFVSRQKLDKFFFDYPRDRQHRCWSSLYSR